MHTRKSPSTQRTPFRVTHHCCCSRSRPSLLLLLCLLLCLPYAGPELLDRKIEDGAPHLAIHIVGGCKGGIQEQQGLVGVPQLLAQAAHLRIVEAALPATAGEQQQRAGMDGVDVRMTLGWRLVSGKLHPAAVHWAVAVHPLASTTQAEAELGGEHGVAAKQQQRRTLVWCRLWYGLRSPPAASLQLLLQVQGMLPLRLCPCMHLPLHCGWPAAVWFTAVGPKAPLRKRDGPQALQASMHILGDIKVRSGS